MAALPSLNDFESAAKPLRRLCAPHLQVIEERFGRSNQTTFPTLLPEHIDLSNGESDSEPSLKGNDYHMIAILGGRSSLVPGVVRTSACLPSTLRPGDDTRRNVYTKTSCDCLPDHLNLLAGLVSSELLYAILAYVAETIAAIPEMRDSSVDWCFD